VKRRQLHGLALACLAGGLRGAGAAEPLLSAFTENLPPLNYLDETGPQGFSVELLRMMAAQAGLKLQLQVLPWVRAVQAAETTPGSVLFSLTRTPEREAQFAWVGPISARRIVVYKLASRSDLNLTELRQLNGARIGVVRESATARQLLAEGFKPGEELEFGLDDATNVRKLLAGRMEYVMLLDWAAAWNLRQLKLPYDSFQAVLDYDTSKSYWYGLRPDTDPALLRRLQAALDTLKRDGRYEALKLRYFS
jgi:polar amino acid transport system substrate-binding protein